MPLVRIQGVFLLTADTADICSTHQALKNAGSGRYRITPLAAAAADATFTVNDGKADVISAEPIPVKAAAVTYPQFDRSADLSWTVDIRGDRLDMDVVDGTSGELAILIEKIG